MPSEFAPHWTLDPGTVFLNHGSFGATPRPVLAAQAEWRERMEREPVAFFARDLEPAMDEARAALGAFVGADPDDLALVPNATAGINIVARSLDLRAGDEVVALDHAYNAATNVLEHAAAAAGARLVVVRLPFPGTTPDLARDVILDAVTPRTRLVMIDHVTSATALVLPVAEIVAALASRGIDALVDGAHAPGMLAIDLERLGADFFVGNLHKWCCAPRGTAVLHAAKNWRPALRPLVASWGEAEGFPLAFDETGTEDPTAWLSAPRALRVLERIGLDRLRRHNVQLAVAGQLEVARALQVEPGDLPRDAAVSMQLVPLPEGVASSVEAADALQDRIGETSAVEVAVTSWAGRGFVRVSAQAYNAPADYRRLAADLPSLL
jgi:isopenicillin-N epimerase